MDFASPPADPEETISKAELALLLEQPVMALPERYRTVFMLRGVEELSTSEAAAALSLTEENAKVRLHRARALIRRELLARVGASAKDAFPFMGQRCDRIVKRVFHCLSASNSEQIPLYY